MNGNPHDDPICPYKKPIDLCWERPSKTSTTHAPTTSGPSHTTSASLLTTTPYNPKCDPDTQKLVDEECSIITNITGPFEICITNATELAQNYFSSCIYDLCATNNPSNIICAILQSYADACMQEIPTISIQWRSEHLCRKWLKYLAQLFMSKCLNMLQHQIVQQMPIMMTAHPVVQPLAVILMHQYFVHCNVVVIVLVILVTCWKMKFAFWASSVAA